MNATRPEQQGPALRPSVLLRFSRNLLVFTPTQQYRAPSAATRQKLLYRIELVNSVFKKTERKRRNYYKTHRPKQQEINSQNEKTIYGTK